MNGYDSYKDSGIEWIGEIPNHWKKGKLKHYFDLSSGKNPSDYDKSDGEYPVYGSNGVIGYTNTPNLFHKTILIGRVGSSGELNYNLFPCSVSDNCLIVEMYGTNDLSFVYYLLKNTGLKNYTTKTSQPLITGSTIKEIETILPPLKEQQEIVSYLDNKTTSIDSLIQSKEKKIKLLNEKRTSLINQVVTKGLNPNVEMKDSGVKWIGEIPSGWEIIPIRFLGDFQNGISKGSEYFGKGFPFMNYGDVYNNEVTPNNVDGLVQSSDKDKYNYSVERGDVFFTRTSETIDDIGISSVCLNTIPECVFSGFVIRYRFHESTHLPEYSRYHFQTHWKKTIIESKMNIVTRSSLSQNVLGQVPVLIPSLPEQKRIVEFLDKETKLIDETISSEQKKIELLKEYKQSLISEVVTGKRKVVLN